MSDIMTLNDALQAQLKHMERSGELFVVDVEKDELWDVYLSSFPEGTNPIYRERTQHDCNCCKQFIRDIGGVVAIDGRNKLVSIWDVDAENEFQVVVDALSEFIKSKPIKNVYRHIQKKVGTPKSLQNTEDGQIIRWNHFNAVLKPQYVVNGRSVGDVTGEYKANYDVLKRSLDEITSNAIDVVSELIAENSIYRGQEFKSIVTKLKDVKKKYDKIKDAKLRDNFLWKQSSELKQAARFKNTVIGTLLADISGGVDLEDAVRMYESKVAPQNYKRSSALITQGMIDKANKTVSELGIEDSLYRRYANEGDITINNVLFADRSTKKNMKEGGLLDDLSPTKKPNVSKKMDKVQEIGIDDFVNNVLPEIDSLEVFVKNKHVGNFVSLVAPVNEDSKGIFKWDNNFSWSYNGDVTDSIKERVKQAGGNVTGDVRASLSWSNYDDLDIHVIEPNNNHIHYANKNSRDTGGKLDVDMNAGGRNSRTPVENVYWPNSAKMKDGTYKVYVNNFTKRESIDVGFDVEVEIHGDIIQYSYDQEVRNHANVPVLEFTKKNGEIKVSKEFLTSSTASKEVWGVDTEDFQKVKMVMNSPNHWDDQTVGNKHWFFMLEGCANPDKARGFYNEFLTNDLNEHRKVFEVLASKMKTDETDNQLSGLGFSSTKRDELLCKVTGSYTRMLKIKF